MLDRFIVVLYEPQDLVNIALVVRAMKNMGLSRLHVVSPAEFDAYRIEGIAHDTSEIVAAAEIFDDFDAAVSGCIRVVATTARRRTRQQSWSEPVGAARALLDRTAAGDVALVFGREDRGLPNDILDRSDEAICIPTTEHSSLNLGHAAVIIFYEIRQAVRARFGVADRDLSGKLRDQADPATAGELEDFFEVWEGAMHTIGMFRGVPPIMKMRSYRRILRRADMDRRELRLFKATAHRIARHARRAEARIRDELRREGASELPDSESGMPDSS